MTSVWRVVVGVLVVGLMGPVGCGGAAGGLADEAKKAGPVISGPPEPWDEMSREARGNYMRERVLPTMKPLFAKYDAGYADMTCATCHGKDGRERNFAMPNPGLERLYPSGSAEQKATVAEHPEAVRFMFNQVIPTMSALLGTQPYDEETGDGLTCFFCHTEGKPAAAP